MLKLGVNNSEVGRLMGMPNGEMVRRYAGGYAMPRKAKLTKLAKLLGIPEAELVFGQAGEGRSTSDDLTKPLTPEERMLLDTYAQLPDTARKILRARAVELLEAFGQPSNRNPFGKGTQ